MPNYHLAIKFVCLAFNSWKYLNFQDYAIETPLEILPNSEGQPLYEMQIKFDKDIPIAAVNFVLKVSTLHHCIAFYVIF
jgi:hypothetical protein